MNNRKLLRYIKKNFKYEDYIEENGLSTKPSNNPDEIRICCPSCGESDYKCYVNTEKCVFICHKCDFGRYGNGDVFDFVAHVEGITTPAAIQRLSSDYRAFTPDDISFEDEEEEEKPLASFANIKKIDGLPRHSRLVTEEDQNAAPFAEYLLQRGFTWDEIKAMRTYYTPKLRLVRRANGKTVNISNRILWPVYGGDGSLVSWLTRSISSDPAKNKIKYINAPDTEMAKTFWPFVPVPATKPEAVLCEGVIDALSVRRAGYYSYACFGKKLSEEQIQLLQYWGVKSVTLFFDLDAKSSTKRTVEQLKLRFDHVYVVDLSVWKNIDDGKVDAGSLLAKENGNTLIQQVMAARINTSDELAYIRWSLSE